RQEDLRLRSRSRGAAHESYRGEDARPPIPRMRDGRSLTTLSRVSEAVSLSSPDRVLFPEDGVTKGDLFEYYREVASAILPHRPDFVLFDLDPPDEPDGFEQAIEVAHLIRGLLDELELPGYVKTSGADGIHVVAPITRRSTFEETYDFAERASRLLERRHDGLVTTEWLKKKRRGVLVDHRQNGW